MFRMKSSFGRLLSISMLLPSAAASQAVGPTPSNEGPRHECFMRQQAFDTGRPVEPTFVKFTITAEGAVKDISIDKSSGHFDVDKAAVACVSEWRYHPATQDGTPVEKLWQARISWNAGWPPSSK
jgi:TonB family protein